MKESFRRRILICVLPLIAAGALAAIAWKNTTADAAAAPLNEEERKKESGKLRYNLGVDLAGGTTLEYEVDRAWWEKQVRETKEEILRTFNSSDLASALKRRIDPNNLMETTIRPVGEPTATDPPRVEIILPLKAGKGGRGAADLATIKDRIGQQGRLEFRIVADNRDPDDQEAIRLAQETLKAVNFKADRLTAPPAPQSGGEPFQTQSARYEWIELEETKDRTGRPIGEAVDRKYSLTIWDEGAKRAISNPAVPPAGFQIEPGIKADDPGQQPRDNPYRNQAVYHATSEDEMRAIGDLDGDGRLDPAHEQPKTRHFLLTKITLDKDGTLVPPDKDGRPGAIEVTGEDLSRVNPDTDPQTMQWVTQFALKTTSEGNRASADQRFKALTKPGKDFPNERAMAIILDGKVISAPHLRQQLSDGGIITMGSSSGAETKRRVDTLVLLLRSGQLPAVLNPNPVSEETIDSTLGAKAVEEGTLAVAIAFAAVVVFMIFYYRFAGFVASVALFANLLLTVGFMVMVKATFTLSGLAGLVLMLGMAVDANVLIYERIREERERGAGLALAIRNGYDRAFPTIIDTHLTSIFTSIVLYVVGNDQLKGFGVSLTAGLIISLFTSLYMTRLMFDISLQQGWLKELRMMKLLSKPNINFMKWRYHWFAITVTLSMLGLVVFVGRGERGLNIELTGGTEYSVQFTSSQNREEVAKKIEAHLAQKGLPLDVSVTGDPESANLTFRGRFLGEDARQRGRDARHELQTAVEEAFGPQLVYLNAKPGLIEPAATAAIKGTNRYRVELTFSDQGDAMVAPDQVRQVVNQWYTKHKPKEGAPHHYFAIAGVGEGKNGLFPSVAVLFSIPDELRPIPDATSPAEQNLAKEIAARTAAVQAAGEIGIRAALVGAGPAGLAVAPLPGPGPDELADLARFVVTIAQEMHHPKTDRLKSVGSSLADRTQLKAFYAIGLSWLVICLYLWFRFGNWTFGLAAVLCLIHDVTFAIGLIGVSHWVAGTPPGDLLLIHDFKMDLPAIAALLTLVGFSVNDTIVVFDRIREVRGKSPELTAQIINDSVNQTLSRTLLTSFIVWLVVVVLYILGGEGIHLFSFVMVTGVLIGTYSSIFVASPLLLWLGEGRQEEPVRGKAAVQEATV